MFPWAFSKIWLKVGAGGDHAHGVAVPDRVRDDAAASRYGLLRELHAWLAYALLATVLLHAAAALHHLWVRRDEVFPHMALWTNRTPVLTAEPVEATESTASAEGVIDADERKE